MALGPVDVVIIGFPGNKFTGRIAPAIDDLVRKGVIRDPAVHDRVLDEVTAAGAEVGLTRVGSTPSPITGQKGNVEFLLHLRRDASVGTA